MCKGLVIHTLESYLRDILTVDGLHYPFKVVEKCLEDGFYSCVYRADVCRGHWWCSGMRLHVYLIGRRGCRVMKYFCLVALDSS
jgi:hypothetical protein